MYQEGPIYDQNRAGFGILYDPPPIWDYHLQCLYIMLLKNCSVTTNHTFLFEIVHLILYNLYNCELGD